MLKNCKKKSKIHIMSVQVDASGEIIVMTECACPWKEHLFDLEEEKGIEGVIKFTLYSDSNGSWRVQCVPDKTKNFTNR